MAKGHHFEVKVPFGDGGVRDPNRPHVTLDGITLKGVRKFELISQHDGLPVVRVEFMQATVNADGSLPVFPRSTAEPQKES